MEEMDADGIYLFERGGTNRHFPTRTRRVADVTGAGDMVLSVLGVVLGAGGTLTQAVDLANHAAGIELRRMGVSPLSRREIVESVLAQLLPPDKEEAGLMRELDRQLERVADRGLPSPALAAGARIPIDVKLARRIVARLARRGFSQGAIRRAMELRGVELDYGS